MVKYHYVRQQDDRWVKENIERRISIGSCGSGVVSTDDSWTGPIVATKRHDDNDGKMSSSSHSESYGTSSSSGHCKGEGKDSKGNGKNSEMNCDKCKENKPPMCIMPTSGAKIPLHEAEKISNAMKHGTPLAEQHGNEQSKLKLKDALTSKKGLKKRLECLIE